MTKPIRKIIYYYFYLQPRMKYSIFKHYLKREIKLLIHFFSMSYTYGIRNGLISRKVIKTYLVEMDDRILNGHEVTEEDIIKYKEIKGLEFK